MNEPNGDLVVVRSLKKHYPIRRGLLQRPHRWVKAVDDVSFGIRAGETLGLVGESGCGKTTVGLSMLRLVEPSAGEIWFEGRDILALRGRQLNLLRRHMQVIFQDPYSSLNPRIPIGVSVAEGLRTHQIGHAAERRARVIEMLRRVGLEEYHADRYPHEFSGGQRQRVGIARALVLHPKLVVCDEAVSALDVSIQAQVLNLLKDLQQEFQLTYLFIAHNMNVVEYMADRVAVMYLGKIVEMASKPALFRNPRHPYTQALMSAIPGPNPYRSGQRIRLSGDVPNPANPPSGCRFHPRCPLAVARCAQEEPPLVEVQDGHSAACWLA
jgi:peptide/nickel transport system ATP-binding protein/oligopeptide transport system ATP-binding protein